MEGGRTVMDDAVDRHAPNPNRVTQPFDEIGKSSDGGELDAQERFYWSKIRQGIKDGNLVLASGILRMANDECGYKMVVRLVDRIKATFTAGCIALGDPAPLDKEQDHE